MNEILLPKTVAVIIGVFAPIIIQYLKTITESKQIRFFIALFVAGATGLIGAIVAGGVPAWANIIEFVVIAFAMSQTAYATWKNLIP